MLSPNAADALGVQSGDCITLHTPAGDLEFLVSGFGTEDADYYNNQTFLVGVYMPWGAFHSLMEKNGITDNERIYYVQFESAAKAADAITELQSQYQLPDKSISENVGVMGMAGKSSNTGMNGMYELAALLFILVLLAGVLMGSHQQRIFQ